MNDLIADPKQAIQAIMDRNGWSQNKLAHESGVSQSTLSRVLSGEDDRGMHSKNLQKLLPFLYPAPGDSVPPPEGVE